MFGRRAAELASSAQGAMDEQGATTTPIALRAQMRNTLSLSAIPMQEVPSHA